jgi:hypothetical protein
LSPPWVTVLSGSDGAWLGSAEQLALALDSATNNTSLALAIELVESGQVLLFPADAQVGNWLSWHSLRWEEGDQTVTAPDLLARTRFYKVGHHGSHNATLKTKGLEMMPAHGMIAFIPVDGDMAKAKRWFEMPLPHLVEALREHCGEAVIRIDRDLPPDLPGVAQRREGRAVRRPVLRMGPAALIGRNAQLHPHRSGLDPYAGVIPRMPADRNADLFWNRGH